MTQSPKMTRHDFFVSCGAVAAGTLLGPRLFAAEVGRGEIPGPLYLTSWKPIELPGERKFKQFLKITASDGSVGYCRALGGTSDLKLAERAVARADLLDHEALCDLMAAKNVPRSQLKIMDIACWDLHARLTDQPLHALLGTRKKKIIRYGDVRWHAADMTPERYAKQVASYLDRTGMIATKLHFPGAMGTEHSITLKDAMATLAAVREAVGDEKILAWDPYPRTAESATHSVEEARQMIRLMDELGYAWLEGPLPPVPFETQIPKYVELMEMKPKLRIQAEGPGSPIGDGTPFEIMKQWVEAGAVNQCSTDAYIANGVTNAWRMLEYARNHPERRLVVNLHWAWAPHAHLAMAYDDSICPTAEFPMTEDIPKEYLAGPYLRAPDWPGIYCID